MYVKLIKEEFDKIKNQVHIESVIDESEYNIELSPIYITSTGDKRVASNLLEYYVMIESSINSDLILGIYSKTGLDGIQKLVKDLSNLLGKVSIDDSDYELLRNHRATSIYYRSNINSDPNDLKFILILSAIISNLEGGNYHKEASFIWDSISYHYDMPSWWNWMIRDAYDYYGYTGYDLDRCRRWIKYTPVIVNYFNSINLNK